MLIQSVKIKDLILRPQVKILDLKEYSDELSEYINSIPDNFINEIIDGAEILIKYSEIRASTFNLPPQIVGVLPKIKKKLIICKFLKK